MEALETAVNKCPVKLNVSDKGTLVLFGLYRW